MSNRALGQHDKLNESAQDPPPLPKPQYLKQKETTMQLKKETKTRNFIIYKGNTVINNFLGGFKIAKNPYLPDQFTCGNFLNTHTNNATKWKIH